MNRRGNTRSVALVALASVLAAGCAPKFDEVWQLSDFRVLGVKATPAEPDRGQSVSLRLISIDPHDRPVQVTWFLCAQAVSILPSDAGTPEGDGGGSGMSAFGCNPENLQIGIGTNPTFQVPPGGGTLDSAGREVLTVFAYACAGGTIGIPADGGTTPTCNATDGDATGWLFSRSIFIHSPGSLNPPNQNPSVQNVRFGPLTDNPPIALATPPQAYACRDQHACTHYHFTIDFTPESRETYLDRNGITGATESFTERLTTGYIVDKGTLAGGFRTDSNVVPSSDMEDTWTPPAETGPVNVYIYAADNRGGFEYTRRVINVVPEATGTAQPALGSDAATDAPDASTMDSAMGAEAGFDGGGTD